MKIFEIARNPIVKWVGIFTILYFAVMSNKDDPKSISNKLSQEQIANNLKSAKEKGGYIFDTIKNAKNLSKDHPESLNSDNLLNQKYEEISPVVSCGDATFSYAIFNKNKERIYFQPQENLIIGSKSNPLFESKIKGAKIGETIVFQVSENNYIHGGKKIEELAKQHGPNLEVEAMVIAFIPSFDKKLPCE